MTRDRALKHAIRARAAKTGERYTTARRQLLRARRPPTAAAPRPSVLPARPVAPAAGDKSPVADARTIANTGHDLAYWFDLLDRFGAVEKGHTAAARHLRENHGVSSWYSQGITVAYERARGVRRVNQRGDGEYEVSVSKVVAADTATVARTLSNPRLHRRLSGVDAELLQALGSALKKPAKGIVLRPDGLGSFRYRWGATTVQLYLVPKPGGKSSLVATNGKLGSAAMVEARRAQWRAALNALAVLLAS